jgi:quercetin dioxygenase-like cupin family protein
MNTKIIHAFPARGLLAWLLVALVAASAGCANRCDDRACSSGGIVNRELLKTTRSWDGRLLPPYPRGQPEVSIRRIIIPPGARLPVHKHPVINAGVLLRGQLNVVKEGGPTLRLKEGDAIAELVDAWHYGYNPGKIPAEIVVVYAGSPGVATTVLKP